MPDVESGDCQHGIPIGATEIWIAEEAWVAVQGTVDEAKLKGCKCWLSLDLSQKNDLTALSVCWLDADGHLWVKTFYWTTKSGLADRARADQAPYEQWVEAGHLTAVPGATIDKTFIAAKVAELCGTRGRVPRLRRCRHGRFHCRLRDGRLPGLALEGPDEPEGQGLKLVAHAQGTRRVFGFDLYKITLRLRPAAGGGDLVPLWRTSTDGVNFASGAGAYNNAFVYQNGNSLTQSPAVASTYGVLGGNVSDDFTGLSSWVEALFERGAAGASPSIITRSAEFSGTAFAQSLRYGIRAANVPVTHLLIASTVAAGFDAGTRLIVEAA